MSTVAKSYTSIGLDVTAFNGCPNEISGPLSLAAWVFIPPALPKIPKVLVCLPGGSYTKAYYHLEVPGFPPDSYSFALAMAQQGFIVVALDHLGVGDSIISANGAQLTMSVLAAANAAAVRVIRKHLQEGTLLAELPAQQEVVMVGIGHSMGSFLLLAQQAAYPSFSAIALLGFTTGEISTAGMERHLAETLGLEPGTAHEAISRLYTGTPSGYMALDRTIAHALFYANDVPEAVMIADDALVSAIPLGTTVDMSQPGAMLPLASEVDVPLFLANGALFDMSADFRAEPTSYRRATDISLYLLEGSAHCHNFASSRHTLWNRLARWVLTLEQRTSLG